MAPMAGGVADGEEDQAGVGAGEGEGGGGPELPGYWVRGMGAYLDERIWLVGDFVVRRTDARKDFETPRTYS